MSLRSVVTECLEVQKKIIEALHISLEEQQLAKQLMRQAATIKFEKKSNIKFFSCIKISLFSVYSYRIFQNSNVDNTMYYSKNLIFPNLKTFVD